MNTEELNDLIAKNDNERLALVRENNQLIIANNALVQRMMAMLPEMLPKEPSAERVAEHEARQKNNLRDHFSAHALIGLLSGQYSETGSYNLSDLPKEAFAIADAMLEARK